MYTNSKKYDVQKKNAKSVDVNKNTSTVELKEKLKEKLNEKSKDQLQEELQEEESCVDEELMNYYLYDDVDAYDDEGYQDECYDCLDL